MAAVAFAVVPANAARVSAGCSGPISTKTEASIEAMADGEGKIVAQKEIAARAGRDAQRQDGCVRHASEQGDASQHGASKQRTSYRGPVALRSALWSCRAYSGRARELGGEIGRWSWNRPRSCSTAGAPRNWRCRAPNPCRAASHSRRDNSRSRPARRARCARDRGGRCRRNRRRI